MRVLLVEPTYRRLTRQKLAANKESYTQDTDNRKYGGKDETLWYPPLGLLKLARFHVNLGDEVAFVNGCAPEMVEENLISPSKAWDRIYIATLFTYHYDKVIKTINYYKKFIIGTTGKIYIGGVMASLMANSIHKETGIHPLVGILSSPKQIHLPGNVNIDRLSPYYDILDDRLYAINDTFYAYTSRGCVNKCPWCCVPKIETKYDPYIDIKSMIYELRNDYGDKPVLKLMDNNVLASNKFTKIIDDLLKLGYGKGQFTNQKKQRVIDYNQGLDARFLTEDKMRLLSQLNIKPMRIGFDRVSEMDTYVRAVELAHKYGIRKFSNYMLYNWEDTPKDLYRRLMINIELNQRWSNPSKGEMKTQIYSYPMRYAPIDEMNGRGANKVRENMTSDSAGRRNWLKNAVWTKRFIRNVEIMKGAAHGAISPTPGLALRIIGYTYQQYIANLYMPEELLRNRNKHERKVYRNEPIRPPGTGLIECFRRFIISKLKKRDKTFVIFHEAVSPNTVEAIRKAMNNHNRKLDKWLKLYLVK